MAAWAISRARILIAAATPVSGSDAITSGGEAGTSSGIKLSCAGCTLVLLARWGPRSLSRTCIRPNAETGNQLVGVQQLRRRGEDRRCLPRGMGIVRHRGVAVGPGRRHQGLAPIREHDQQLVAAESAHRPDHLQPLALHGMPRPGHHDLIHRAVPTPSVRT
jgi:hypothetical protein